MINTLKDISFRFPDCNIIGKRDDCISKAILDFNSPIRHKGIIGRLNILPVICKIIRLVKPNIIIYKNIDLGTIYRKIKYGQ